LQSNTLNLCSLGSLMGLYNKSFEFCQMLLKKRLFICIAAENTLALMPASFCPFRPSLPLSPSRVPSGGRAIRKRRVKLSAYILSLNQGVRRGTQSLTGPFSRDQCVDPSQVTNVTTNMRGRSNNISEELRNRTRMATAHVRTDYAAAYVIDLFATKNA
jgi:hypothetical protein